MENSINFEEDLILSDIIVTEKIGVGFGSITAPEMSQEEAEKEASEVAKYKVSIDWQNPAVCIDGRTLSKELSLSKLPIGAHIAGGVETVLVGAEATGYHLKGKELVDSLANKGFTLGAHVDTFNKENDFHDGTGCGACDKCDGNNRLFAANKSLLKDTVANLIGDDFSNDIFEKLELTSVSVDNKLAKELAGEELTEVLVDDGEGVHGHREQMVVFNYEENTTIDRDAYFEATGKQVFVVDVWYIKKLADAMATGSHASTQAKELYHAMVSFQVATYIGLCDGSHRAVVLD